uniref:GT4 family glycosyltransferase PelF n=1 Tax=Nonlabens sp. Ci31 TaxID=2608253 RepID=UPI001F0EBC53|nr:GT4 family glycosyltransferase PelF [Nonlabens sp. Ci31]
MLVTEGTYPYNGGGVSTWSHILCTETKNTDFTIYAINAAFESATKYDLPVSVKNILQIPLWTPDEPHDYISYGDEYYKTIGKKVWTTRKPVSTQFTPLFKELLEFIYSDQKNIPLLDEIFKKLWLYFEDYDFKETMRQEAVWKVYKETIEKVVKKERNPDASLMDLTIGMRWIYRFLIPLSITDVPKVDITHLTLSGFAVIPALIAQYKYGSKIVLTEHGVFIRERLLAINSSEYPFFLKKLLINFSEAFSRLTYYKAEKIISVNEFNIKWEQLYGAPLDKIEVIYNGVDHELFKPREKPEHLKGIPTVVALARIFELKDVLTMIRSCAFAKAKLPNIQYLVYGDDQAVPEYTAECLDLIKKLQLENNFKLMGPRKNSHLLFCEGDVSILTSISEGFPYTVIESMASGIPVISTDVGGVKEALDEGSGFLCKPKNAEELGNRVVQLLLDEALRRSMGIHARQRVLDHFTLDLFIDQYEKAYENVLSSTILESNSSQIENAQTTYSTTNS